jgi:hypothetical protein
MGAVLTGAGVATAWLLIVGLLSTSVAAYLWLSLAAAVPAWLTAAVLLRFGDRGVAVGAAAATAVGVGVVFAVIIEQWITVGWPMW